MINNLEKIKPLLKFKNPGDFYFVQILKRRKDNPGMKGYSKCIKNFYLYSVEELDLAWSEMVDLCSRHRARAYIRLNVRNSEKIALMALKKTADHIASGNTRAVDHLYESVCGEHHSETEKKWIIDMDSVGEGDIEEVETLVRELWKEHDHEGKFFAYLPTRHGLHIIASPFNRFGFTDKLKHDVHIDNPTILYIPDFPKVPENWVWA
jgi:tetrahydromethanopterin S-methyltransferase subunit B